MITIKTKEDIKAMQIAGKILHEILDDVSSLVATGVSTSDLNKHAEKLIETRGATSAFKNYKGKKLPYPSALCTSVNNEIVHGIPSQDKILQSGDVVGLDLGIWHKPLNGCKICVDSARSIAVGNVSWQVEKLIETAEQALYVGLSPVKEGAFIADIAEAIQKYVESQGFNVVRGLVGHGVGYKVHEPPAVPNFWVDKNFRGPKLKTGMTLAIEPMVVLGDYHTKELEDGWTVVTKDGSPSAHFEHTVAVTKTGYRILT